MKFLAASLLLTMAAPVLAMPLPGTGLDISAEANLLTDYRFRGVSRSDEDPALQGNLTVSHGSGAYTGARVTTLKGFDAFRFRDPNFEDLGDVQLDLYAGYGAELASGLSLDGGLMYYVFTGGEGATNYFEPYASASYLIGPIEATAGAKYAPSQRAIGDEDMLYLFGEVEAGIPFTPITLLAHAGRQDWGSYGSYWNWSVGGRASLGAINATLRYVDTGLPAVQGIPGQPPLSGIDGGFIASLGVRF